MSVRTAFAHIAIAIASVVAAGCTRAPDDATPTPQPRTPTSTLTPIPISMASGMATPGPKSFPFPRPTASPTPRPSPTPPIPTSPLFVDGPAHRVYASGPLSGTARLSVFDTRDGRLVATAPLAMDERLLDIDREGRRLYVYRAAEGVRVLDADTLDEVGRVGLPTPDPGDEAAIGFTPWPRLRQWPLVRPVTHQLVTFDGMTVRLHDGASGVEVDAFDVPLEGEVGPIKNASFSADGRVLYVAVADTDLAPWDGNAGAIIVALDMDTRRVIERRNLRATITEWLAWGDSLLIEGTVDKLAGLWHILWVGGHERRRLVGAEWTWHWSEFDARRGRLVGSLNSHEPSYSAALWHTVADPTTLDLEYMSPVRLGPPFAYSWDSDNPPLTVYDDVTDQPFGRSRNRQLNRAAAADVAPDAAPADEPAPRQTVRALSAVLPAAGESGTPLAYMGIVTTTSRAGTPTPTFGNPEFHPVIRRAGDPTWRLNHPAGVPAWPDAVVAAPAASASADGGTLLFGLITGVGVFRSTDLGRSWQPASAGIDAVNIRDIDVSPDYAHDRTLFATSHTDMPPDADADDDPSASAWRSRDGGARWEPIGRYAALAVSPEFARDRTVIAFEHLGAQCFISTDGGDHWSAGGALGSKGGNVDDYRYEGLFADESWIIPAAAGGPRILLAMGTTGTGYGGGSHWPEWGIRLFRSIDDGITWSLAWSPDRHWDGMDNSLGDAELLGETGGTLVLRASTYRSSALLSRDGGMTWQERWVADEPEAVPLAVAPDGVVVGAGRRRTAGREGVWTVALDGFVDRPLPDP